MADDHTPCFAACCHPSAEQRVSAQGQSNATGLHKHDGEHADESVALEDGSRKWTRGPVDSCDCSWTSAKQCRPLGNDNTPCWLPCCQPSPKQFEQAEANLRVWTDADFDHAFAALKSPLPVGLMYLQLGPWPRWASFLLQSAAANAALNFYFLGSSHIDVSGCANCAWLPVSDTLLRHRMVAHLGLPEPQHELSGRKLCDLKPMWPAMLPEIVRRHEWIGFADSDIVFGNLSAEVARLRPDDDLLVPQAFYPQPLANGNLVIMRAVPKMVMAFRRSPHWRAAALTTYYQAFDEWGHAESDWGASTMAKVYLDMLLEDNLRARPTAAFFVQDTIVTQGRSYPTIDSYNSRVNITWRAGALVAEREGPCVCPRDVVPQFALSMCAQCLFSPGVVVPASRTHRRVDAVGFHFQGWKRKQQFRRATAMACQGGYEHGFRVDALNGFACMQEAETAG